MAHVGSGSILFLPSVLVITEHYNRFREGRRIKDMGERIFYPCNSSSPKTHGSPAIELAR
jgi:hypothetical protein